MIFYGTRQKKLFLTEKFNNEFWNELDIFFIDKYFS